MNYRVTDNMPQFKRSAYIVLGDALKEGATDILILAKTKAPFKLGGLRADTEISTPRPMARRVSFWKEYARFQELGGDSKRKVRHYTTPATGKGYLKTAGDTVALRMNTMFVKHGKRARV